MVLERTFHNLELQRCCVMTLADDCSRLQESAEKLIVCYREPLNVYSTPYYSVLLLALDLLLMRNHPTYFSFSSFSFTRQPSPEN